MGLLTDPNSGRGSIGKYLSKWYVPICLFMWLSGILWFSILAHTSFNNERYFSENALLPGLVQSETTEEVAALSRTLLSELVTESNRFSENMPYSFLLAKMQALGLEAYEHNFTLIYPLGKEQIYEGKNIYGILRASRAASTESIVFSSPYRSSKSYHDNSLPGIAAMLSFAHFARKQKYWAKDLIFLITEHEMLGAQAWLEAYHGVSEDINTPSGQGRALRSGKLKIRAGSIQAAINLEIHDLKLDHIDIKLEGLNGQLPNLDLINLCHRMCAKEDIRNTFKHKQPLGNRNKQKTFTIDHWWHSFSTMFNMVLTQVTGMPNGNHGLFHRFGIEAVTLEGVSRDEPNALFLNHNPSSPIKLIRLLEDLSRSLNNLLERFHQSFFFYLLPASDRYISIGQYMPALCLVVGALFIKAFALWLNIFQSSGNLRENSETSYKNIQFKLMSIGGSVLLAHVIGITLMNMPVTITKIGTKYFNMSTDTSLFYGYSFFSAVILFMPFVIGYFSYNLQYDCDILNIMALLELATLLLAIGMNNFSMAFLIGSIYVPFAIFISPQRLRGNSMFKFVWLLLQPLILFSILLILTSSTYFSDEGWFSILKRGIIAIKAGLTYGVVDSIVYGNWAFNMTMALLLPNWILFWQVLNTKIPTIMKTKSE